MSETDKKSDVKIIPLEVSYYKYEIGSEFLVNKI